MRVSYWAKPIENEASHGTFVVNSVCANRSLLAGANSRLHIFTGKSQGFSPETLLEYFAFIGSNVE